MGRGCWTGLCRAGGGADRQRCTRQLANSLAVLVPPLKHLLVRSRGLRVAFSPLTRSLSTRGVCGRRRRVQGADGRPHERWRALQSKREWCALYRGQSEAVWLVWLAGGGLYSREGRRGLQGMRANQRAVRERQRGNDWLRRRSRSAGGAGGGGPGRTQGWGQVARASFQQRGRGGAGLAGQDQATERGGAARG